MKTLFSIFLSIILTSCQKYDVAEHHTSIDTEVQERTSYVLSGKVVWSADTIEGVGSVTLNLTGPENQSVVTGNDGLYSFTVSTAGSYTITPTKTINLLNGVTTADATLIQQYVANIISFNTFQVVSADANKSNTITTADASIVNQAFLGNPAAQTILKPSWTFVDRSYVFGSVPPIPSYPKTITISVSSNVSQLDFVGIKRGDVNNSCNPDN